MNVDYDGGFVFKLLRVLPRLQATLCVESAVYLTHLSCVPKVCLKTYVVLNTSLFFCNSCCNVFIISGQNYDLSTEMENIQIV